MQETLNKIAQLKGTAKLEFIKNLVNDAKNVPVLLHLAQNEKSYNKDCALQGLAQFEVEEALPIFKKLLKSKNKGEKILLYGTSDMVSDLVAEEIQAFLPNYFKIKTVINFQLIISKNFSKYFRSYWAKQAKKCKTFAVFWLKIMTNLLLLVSNGQLMNIFIFIIFPKKIRRKFFHKPSPFLSLEILTRD